jgi:hypothetical protein
MARRKGKKGGKAVSRTVTLDMRMVKPSPLMVSPQAGYKQRFYESAGGNRIITRADMLSRLVMASSATVGYRLFSAVKLNKVTIFGANDAPGSVIQNSLQWLSTSGPSQLITETSTSSAYPSVLATRPPKASLASFWSQVGTNESEQLCIMKLNIGDVVEVDFQAVLQNSYLGFNPAGTAITISSGTAATIGAPSLDHSGSTAVVCEGWKPYA